MAYKRLFEDNTKDPMGIISILEDGFDIPKNVAEKYAWKLLKLPQHYKNNFKYISSILTDILPSHSNIKKATNMIIDEL